MTFFAQYFLQKGIKIKEEDENNIIIDLGINLE